MSGSVPDSMELQSNGTDEGNDGALSPPSHSSVNDTKYSKSLRHYLTREALPYESNYRNLESIVADNSNRPRPTLEDLHESTIQQPPGGQTTLDAEVTAKDAKDKASKAIKFGWINGVFIRCILNIWGVMLFLRITWMVAQMGLIETILCVTCANVVTVITAISMSAVATNGTIKGGGVYYIISRALGPEFGAPIGLMFTLANSIAVATYIIGFINGLQDMLRDYFNVRMIDGAVNDIRLIGTVTIVVLLIIAIIGMDWVARLQVVFLVLLLAAQLNYVIGTLIGPVSDEEMAQGFVGLNAELFVKNAFSDYRKAEGKQQNFISVFAVFFPSVTGIAAGANLSGDLKNPSSAIPKGTLLAIAVTYVSYIIHPILAAGAFVRDASGNVESFRKFYYNNTAFINGSLSILDAPTFNEECPLAWPRMPPSALNPNLTACKYGIHNNFQSMETMASIGTIIYIGCFAATLSSAIAALVGAPRVFQALAKDRLYPGLHFFAKGYGGNNDPVRGYLLVFFISVGCTMIGDLNVVSTLLSNFFLASYALINLSCFHASLVKSPGWRPSFKWYNQWVSLLGALLCIVAMFLIDYVMALVTFLVISALYLFVSIRKPDVNWGSSTQGATYVNALKHVHDLQYVEEHVKNYRPQILVLTGSPMSRQPLLDFATLFSKNTAFLACGQIAKPMEFRNRSLIVNRSVDWIKSHKYKALYYLIEAEDLEKGARALYQLVGMTKMKPNQVLIGYKRDWQTCANSDLRAYFYTLHAAFSMQLGIQILRLPFGLDFSEVLEEDEGPAPSEPTAKGGNLNSGKKNTKQARDRVGSDASTPPASPGLERAVSQEAPEETKKDQKKRRASLANLSKDNLNKITIFQRKHKKGTIDVWWLYDDGGLTMLLPYLLSTRSVFQGSSLRVFALANSEGQLDGEQKNLAQLLSKFRIDCAVEMVPIALAKPSEDAKRRFGDIIKCWRTTDDVGDGVTISDRELINQKEKTNRHIRLRELMEERSMGANVIVMTLPMPRKGQVSAGLFMGWLEYLTRGDHMPPFLFVRGNQQSVLTFYS